MNDNRIPGDEGPSDGLFLTNSDRVRVISNLASGNAANGYHPDATSDHNVFMANSAASRRRPAAPRRRAAATAAATTPSRSRAC